MAASASNHELFFPFSEGVPCDTAQEHEHADGSTTIESSEMFVFSPSHPRWEPYPDKVSKIKGEGNNTAKCHHIPDNRAHPNSSMEWENSITLICSLLYRDGAAVVQNACTDADCLSAQSSLRETSRSSSKSHTLTGTDCVIGAAADVSSLIHSPLIMTLCNGIIGRQALKMSEESLIQCTTPKGLFTGDKVIRTLPWELDDLNCSLPPFDNSSSKSIRASDHTSDQTDEIEVEDNQSIKHSYSNHIRSPLLSHAHTPPKFNVGMNQHLTVLWSFGDVEVRIQTQNEGSDPTITHVLSRGDAIILLPDETSDLQAFEQLGGGSEECEEEKGFGWMSCSYHTCFLRQRTNLVRLVPPLKALALSPPLQRLLGYSMPGPILNKLYCGPGHIDILKAYESYAKAFDWASSVSDQPCEAAERDFLRAVRHLKGEEVASIQLGEFDPTSIKKPSFSDIEGKALLLDTDKAQEGCLPQGVSCSSNGLVTVDSFAVDSFEWLLAALHRYGCVVLGSGVSGDTCDEVIGQLSPYSQEMKGAAVGTTVARSKSTWALTMNPFVMAVCEVILGDQLLSNGSGTRGNGAAYTSQGGNSRWQLQLAVTLPKQPGSVEQELHRDGDLSLLDLPKLTGLENAVSVIWALDEDFTEERGATRVCPGSHNWPRSTLPNGSIPAVMKRGSGIIYTGRTMHGVGHNKSDKPRVAFATAYNSAYLKQEENMHAANPSDISCRYPADLRHLIGEY